LPSRIAYKLYSFGDNKSYLAEMGNSFGYNDKVGTILQFAGFIITLILLIFVEMLEKKKK